MMVYNRRGVCLAILLSISARLSDYGNDFFIILLILRFR